MKILLLATLIFSNVLMANDEIQTDQNIVLNNDNINLSINTNQTDSDADLYGTYN